MVGDAERPSVPVLVLMESKGDRGELLSASDEMVRLAGPAEGLLMRARRARAMALKPAASEGVATSATAYRFFETYDLA